MKIEDLSYCGLNCKKCPVRIATLTKDKMLKAQLAEEYSDADCSFAKEDMVCTGCHASSGINKKMCAECDMRLCGQSKGISNCAECAEYPCALIEKHLPAGSENRSLLDELAPLFTDH